MNNRNDETYFSYKKILEKLQAGNQTTSTGKNIKYSDLAQAVKIMNKKHHICRWVQSKEKRNVNYVLIEGYYWLKFVYFQNEKRLIDADISFFKDRIKQYEDLLHIQPKIFWTNDMEIKELVTYFKRTYGTIENSIIKMNKATNGIYKFNVNKKIIISKNGIEWLCKNCFKKKYLELLEEYKMELTEKYIEAGYPYDIW